MDKSGEMQKATLNVSASGGAGRAGSLEVWFLCPALLLIIKHSFHGSPGRQEEKPPRTLSCSGRVGQDVMARKAEKLVSLRSGNMLVLPQKKAWSTSKHRDAATSPLASTLGWLQSLAKSVERLPVI